MPYPFPPRINAALELPRHMLTKTGEEPGLWNSLAPWAQREMHGDNAFCPLDAPFFMHAGGMAEYRGTPVHQMAWRETHC